MPTLSRRNTDAGQGGAPTRSVLADAAWAVEDRVVWGAADLLRALAEAVRWPFERARSGRWRTGSSGRSRKRPRSGADGPAPRPCWGRSRLPQAQRSAASHCPATRAASTGSSVAEAGRSRLRRAVPGRACGKSRRAARGLHGVAPVLPAAGGRRRQRNRVAAAKPPRHPSPKRTGRPKRRHDRSRPRHRARAATGRRRRAGGDQGRAAILRAPSSSTRPAQRPRAVQGRLPRDRDAGAGAGAAAAAAAPARQREGAEGQGAQHRPRAPSTATPTR